MLTADEAREIWQYDPETGELTWKIKPARRIMPGSLAGNLSTLGYWVIRCRIEGYLKEYKRHRLAWLIMTGELPKSDIDHINGIRSDDRFCNLRIATRQENCRNQRKRPWKISKGATSPYKGVYSRDSKWRASIKIDGKTTNLGTFLTEEEAHAAYCKAAKELHGQFARFA